MARTTDKNKLSDKKLREFRGQLLSWYDAHKRDMPWRAGKGRKPNPYHVWLSEIMLQQTTVAAVGPRFIKFIEQWPDIHALAMAKQDDIMNAWAGLGYYARARNLHACAKVVSNDLKGNFPDTQEGLKNLPGIGDYTSAAIITIVHNKPATVVDANVERVMTRYFAVREPLPAIKPYLKEIAAQFFDGFTERPGDMAQSLMELGALICIPNNPRCGACPVAKQCRGRSEGIAASLPAKPTKKTKPAKFGHVYWIEDTKGRVLLHRRPEKGMLGGMLGLPTSAWDQKRSVSDPAFLKTSLDRGASVYHSFTHFDLELRLKTARAGKTTPEGYFWAKKADLQQDTFPTVFKKALGLFLV
jgi:A/G-specific adenine glycosylase